jgi:hypothetical protein
MSSQRQLFSPDHEIIGQNIMFFTDAIEGNNVKPFLEKHKIAHLDPEVWYPAQPLLDAFNEISETNSSMMDFVSLGMKAIETARFPEGIESVPLVESLGMMAASYALNQRGSNIGTITAEKVSDTHVKLSFVLPWPDDIWYGCVYGYTRRFAPKGTRFKVHYDTDVRRCDEGGKVTIIHVTWE